MAKKEKPGAAARDLTKTELFKINRKLKDLRAAAEDGNGALTKEYNSLKKRGFNLPAFKLAEKLAQMDNPQKVQAFLADFDEYRRLYGFDDQLNLFAEEKAEAPAAETKKNAKSNVVALAAPKGRKAKLAEVASAKLTAKGKGVMHKKTEVKAAKAPGRIPRAALFDESSDGDDSPVH